MVALLGCTASDEGKNDGMETTTGAELADGDDTSETDSGDGEGTTGGQDPDDDFDSVDWDSLNGDVPSVAGVLPDFVATNYDTSPRSREDLLGDPTVMWFYPAAATAG